MRGKDADVQRIANGSKEAGTRKEVRKDSSFDSSFDISFSLINILMPLPFLNDCDV